MSERDCNVCKIYYLFAAAVGIAVMVVGLVPLLLLRRKKTGSKGDSDKNHEMTPVTKEEGSIIHRDTVISNGKRKAKEKNAEDVIYSETKKTNCQDEEITYAIVKFNVKGKKSDNVHKSMDSHTTYAEINPKSRQPLPQGGSTDLYACVNNKKNNKKAVNT